MIAVVAMKQGGQPEGKIRLAIMAGDSIYAKVRLRLTANRTYECIVAFIFRIFTYLILSKQVALVSLKRFHQQLFFPLLERHLARLKIVFFALTYHLFY